jgi:hypothetical protein
MHSLELNRLKSGARAEKQQQQSGKMDGICVPCQKLLENHLHFHRTVTSSSPNAPLTQKMKEQKKEKKRKTER